MSYSKSQLVKYAQDYLGYSHKAASKMTAAELESVLDLNRIAAEDEEDFADKVANCSLKKIPNDPQSYTSYELRSIVGKAKDLLGLTTKDINESDKAGLCTYVTRLKRIVAEGVPLISKRSRASLRSSHSMARRCSRSRSRSRRSRRSRKTRRSRKSRSRKSRSRKSRSRKSRSKSRSRRSRY